MLMPYVKAVNHAGIESDFLKLLAPFYPTPCTGDVNLIRAEIPKINCENITYASIASEFKKRPQGKNSGSG